MALHGYINTTHCMGWDNDALNCVGIAQTDIDNGAAVVLGDISLTDGFVDAYEFTVTPATAASTGIYVAKTPESAGTDYNMLMNKDPRNFYNKAGRPISLMRMMPGIDCIEVTAEAFVAGSEPTTQPTYKYATIGADGKYVVAQAAPGTGAYFAILGKHTVAFGQNVATTYVLRCERN